MKLQQSIQKKLLTEFQPAHLEVINESHMHSVAANSESHFKIIVVSEAFQSISRIERHQRVHALLQDELKNGVHALSQVLLTPEEFAQKGGKIPNSPPCQGG